VVLSLATAFPGVAVHTSLFDAGRTFPAFSDCEVRPLPLNRAGLLRRHHRLALPLLAPAFSRLEVEADVVICSSSGWAHGTRVTGRKIVYCHAPARWLYQTDRYLLRRLSVARTALAPLRAPLVRWDRRAAATADRYLVNSTAIQEQVRAIYGIDAEVVPPPVSFDVEGVQEEVHGVVEPYIVCVSRLLAYKNVQSVVEAFRELPDVGLVVVGDGPERAALREAAPPNVRIVGTVSDAQLRGLYASCVGLVAAAWEDFGLAPLEAAAFGKPAAALDFGGYLDTIVEGRTGVLFAEPTPRAIRGAVDDLLARTWDPAAISRHADTFSEARFAQRMRDVVAEEASAA
jgi:glycosyltransferase involved in cell wall biosynthesis